MKIGAFIQLMILSGVFLIVFSFGLKVTWRDVTSLFRQPKQLLRALLAMNGVMPLFTAALITTFDFIPAVKIALILLSVSPILPLLPRKEHRLGVGRSSMYGIFAAISLLAIVLVPLSISVLSYILGVDARISPPAVARVVLLTVLLPLGAGMTVRAWAPRWAERNENAVSKGGVILLLIGIIPVLIVKSREVPLLLGSGTLLAMAVFVAAGLSVGHLLAGPNPDERTVLALATASRHPGVALVIASTDFPGDKSIVAAIFLYLIVCAFVTLPYIRWRKRRRAYEMEKAKGGVG